MRHDFIFRDEAINAMCDNCYTVNADCAHYTCARYEALEKLPAAQQWIPCSERLPEFNQKVLVSSRDGIYIALRYEPWGGGWYEVAEYRDINGVTAWMPLPEPYNQEDNR